MSKFGGETCGQNAIVQQSIIILDMDSDTFWEIHFVTFSHSQKCIYQETPRVEVSNIKLFEKMSDKTMTIMYQ